MSPCGLSLRNENYSLWPFHLQRRSCYSPSRTKAGDGETFLTIEACRCAIHSKDQHPHILVTSYPNSCRKDKVKSIPREGQQTMPHPAFIVVIYLGSTWRVALFISPLNLCRRLEGLELFVRISAVELGRVQAVGNRNQGNVFMLFQDELASRKGNGFPGIRSI